MANDKLKEPKGFTKLKAKGRGGFDKPMPKAPPPKTKGASAGMIGKALKEAY